MRQQNIVFYEPYKYSIHAEKNAILSVKNKNMLKHCKIYIIKLSADKIEIGIPCHVCEKLLDKYGPKICYT